MAVHRQKLCLTPYHDTLSLRVMKKILSLLLCYVFLQSQSFALRGGPAGNSNGIYGAYSGIMVQTGGGSDVGLFMLNAQSTGASNGSLVIFSQDSFYQGTMTGLVSPVSGSFTGLFNATPAVGNTTVVTVVTTATSIAGTLTLSKLGGKINNVQQITGSGASSGGKNYTISGWQTSSSAVTSGFSIGTTSTK